LLRTYRTASSRGQRLFQDEIDGVKRIGRRERDGLAVLVGEEGMPFGTESVRDGLGA
jgi:hypothetical protein